MKSFKINGDTLLLKQILDENNAKYLMVIKRSLVFGMFISYKIIFVLAFAVANGFLFFSEFGNTTEAYLFSSGIGVLILLWLVSIFRYFKKYKEIFGDRNKIMDIYKAIYQSEQADKAFIRFFNQTVGNIVLMLCLGAYMIYSVFNSGMGIMYAIGNITFFLAQIFVTISFLKRMIDMEMDYNIIIGGKIYFANQSWFIGSRNTIVSEKIKEVNAIYPSKIAGIFNYGTIVVSTEGDAAGTASSGGPESMFFVSQPMETEFEINKLLANDIADIEAKENFYLSKISSSLGVTDEELKNNKALLNEYLSKNENIIKNDFDKADSDVKSDIKDLYSKKF